MTTTRFAVQNVRTGAIATMVETRKARSTSTLSRHSTSLGMPDYRIENGPEVNADSDSEFSALTGDKYVRV